MPTIREVAEKAGVSPTTVSHVVNNTRFVSDVVRARVQSAMEELGYRPNALARSLRRGETHTLGLILPDSANPFFAEVSRAIEAVAFDSGYSLILCNTEGDLTKERLYVDVLCNKQVDGIIFVAAGERSDSLQTLLSQELAVVVVDREIEAAEVDTVLSDNHQGGYQATAHMLALGHQRIGCISGPSNVTPSAQRVTGYLEALGDAGIAVGKDWVMPGDFHPSSGRTATLAYLSQPDPPTAIFASNDMMAIGVLRAAAERGLRVPQDLAVVGFDDIELASYTTPPLTTVAQPKAEIGRTAVQMLLERIADKSLPPRGECLPTTLIVRQTCGGGS